MHHCIWVLITKILKDKVQLWEMECTGERERDFIGLVQSPKIIHIYLLTPLIVSSMLFGRDTASPSLYFHRCIHEIISYPEKLNSFQKTPAALLTDREFAFLNWIINPFQLKHDVLSTAQTYFKFYYSAQPISWDI